MTDAERDALPVYDFRKPVKCVSMSRDDIMLWRAADGAVYTFGQYGDGSWYKRAVL